MVDADTELRDTSPGSESAGATGSPRTAGTQFSVPVLGGFVLGAVTFAVNYAAVFALYVVELMQIPAEFSLDPIQQHQVAGWLFFGAHRASIQYRPDGPFSMNMLELVYGAAGLGDLAAFTESHEFAVSIFYGGWMTVREFVMAETADGYMMASMTVPKLAYLAIPVIGLVLGGRALAKRSASGRRLTAQQGAIAGAAIVLGYATLTVATALTVFTVAGDGTDPWQIKPNLESAVMTMGIAYPVILGAIGGLLGR